MSASSPPSVVILGTDAVLAARPATAVQFAHACLKAGYRSAIPASWGDELLATEALHHLADPQRAPTAVYCVCPLVVGRLGSIAQDPASNVVALVSPPVATARYVRALAGDGPLHITYVGGCPDASEREIDARFTPAEFLERLAALGILPANEPLVFDSILPADRRRFRSLPGGVPSAETLWSEGGARALAELDQPDFVADLAQRFLSRERTLIDVATRLGCVCSGAAEGVPPLAARAAVTALEPPRATNSVVDESLDIPLLRRLPRQRTPAFATTAVASRTVRGDVGGEEAGSERIGAAARIAPPAAANGQSGAVGRLEPERPVAPPEERAAAAPPAAEAAAVGQGAEPALEIPEPARRPLPGERGAPAGGVPVASGAEGRALPRAYLLRRRTPRGVRVVEMGEPKPPARTTPLERERTIRSNVEPGAPPREKPPRDLVSRVTAPRIPIITGPVERTGTPAGRAPAPPPAVTPPPAAAAPAAETWHSVAGATSGAASVPPPSMPSPSTPSPTPPSEPSPTAALLDAWVRLSRERPMLQLGAMLALALLFGLVFAALFAAAGGVDERPSAPSADSAAVGGDAPAVAPAAADTIAESAPTRPGAQTRASGSPARAVPAPSRRDAEPGRAAARQPAAQPRPRPPETPVVAAPAEEAAVEAAARPALAPPSADSAVAARPAVADSATLARAREIEALREEFARSRARLDSINRSVDSVAPPPPPPEGR